MPIRHQLVASARRSRARAASSHSRCCRSRTTRRTRRTTYFADGVTEALITELAQIAGLKVTSRTSSMAYKGTTKPLPVIARELEVDVILEGSVVHDRTSVRVTAQLIAADTDQHLWARSYDRPLRNLLPVQTELTKHRRRRHPPSPLAGRESIRPGALPSLKNPVSCSRRGSIGPAFGNPGHS